MIRALAARAAQNGDLRDFVAFLFVGGSGAVAFIVLSSLMIEVRTGAPDWLVSALCWAVLILPVYLGHRAISFRSDAPHGQALPRYVLVQVVGVTLAAAFSYLAYHVLGFPSIAGAATVAVLVAAANFAILKLWAFATG
jgi:putative flippase GtrA